MIESTDPAEALMAAWRSELPDVLNPSSELTKRIMLLAARLDEATRRVLPGLGLTLAEFDVLVSLRRAGRPFQLKPNHLARSLLLSTGGTSNVVNHLVAQGMVEREADPQDARSTWIRLTPDGVALAERAVRINSAAHAEVFAGVPDPAVEAATVALREVFAA
ncbi:MAG TPA: MarR family transcriptional regulator, partial [Micromonosporaceae bacterium]